MSRTEEMRVIIAEKGRHSFKQNFK